MKPPYRDYVRYALIMVRRNCGRKGWKTLIRHAGRVGDDAVHDRRVHAPRCADMP
ncbi:MULTISPECIES: hypothetical protein [Burkholderia]|uniref:hypothetical protein n=1 Tax=Burkholderia TaxID=32008 RepID=UPI000A5F6C68|nr:MULTISPECIES: hypothetical protein [Burkholderia]MBR7961295.1 hypothetical protein [Burkholderia vietnamiensis]MBY4694482.1 hypothetical protein [Burkholderia latens]MCA8309440.1 hypothetical protein [Burkholderia sp. AU28942]QTO44671.1 hypothetical protein J8I85_07215 [Burkholderia latens]